jgi:hypothetical protein
MAALRQAFLRILRDALFERESWREVPEARRVAGRLRVHPEVDQVQQRLHVSLRLHVAAHHAERQPGTAVLERHRGHERMQRPLAWSDHVGVRRIEREQAAAVVQDNPGVSCDDSGAEVFEDRLNQRDDVAVAVGGRQVDGVSMAIRRPSAGG